jgi:hypothetical protein
VAKLARARHLTAGYTTARELAALVRKPCSRSFRARLTILVARGILESKPAYGYRLNGGVEVDAGLE